MNPQKRRAIFERFRAANPHPKSELEHHSPFELLVAVVLSAQATDKGVNKATAKLFPVARTPAAIVKLGVDGLIPYVQSIGLFRNKAKNIVALCGDPAARARRARCPPNREALEELPGVGRKTANVVLNVAFGSRRSPSTRTSSASRTGPASRPARRRRRSSRSCSKFVPDEFKLHAHHWLILHGRYVCIARKPKCPECLIRDLCEYPAQDRYSAMFAPSRDEARRFLIDAWAKYRAGQPLSAAGSARRRIDRAASRISSRSSRIPSTTPIATGSPKGGETNPFLHLSLHLAVAEQLAIDQPPGIRAQFERLRAARGDEHAALHAMLECLGEVIWSAQRQRAPPDAALYLACLERQR